MNKTMSVVMLIMVCLISISCEISHENNEIPISSGNSTVINSSVMPSVDCLLNETCREQYKDQIVEIDGQYYFEIE